MNWEYPPGTLSYILIGPTRPSGPISSNSRTPYRSTCDFSLLGVYWLPSTRHFTASLLLISVPKIQTLGPRPQWWRTGSTPARRCRTSAASVFVVARSVHSLLGLTWDGQAVAASCSYGLPTTSARLGQNNEQRARTCLYSVGSPNKIKLIISIT